MWPDHSCICLKAVLIERRECVCVRERERERERERGMTKMGWDISMIVCEKEN